MCQLNGTSGQARNRPGTGQVRDKSDQGKENSRQGRENSFANFVSLSVAIKLTKRFDMCSSYLTNNR